MTLSITSHFHTFHITIMLSIPQLQAIGKKIDGFVVIDLILGKEQIVAHPFRGDPQIHGCSIPLGSIPPGVVLRRRRSHFYVEGVPLHAGLWEGILCIDTATKLVRKQLIFVVH